MLDDLKQAVLEEVAKIAFLTRLRDPAAHEVPQPLQDKHFFRKHGSAAYYGQWRL